MIKKVLLIVDNPSLKKFMELILKELKYQVVCIEDVFLNQKFDLENDTEEVYLNKKLYQYLNEEFDVLFFLANQSIFFEVVKRFKGVFVLFGFIERYSESCSNSINRLGGFYFLNKIDSIKGRFWFGKSSQNLEYKESGTLKKRQLDLPFGIIDSSPKKRVDSLFSNKEIFFLCPKIGSDSKSNIQYRKIKSIFKDKYKYFIGGEQRIKINDKKVLMNYRNEDYKQKLLESEVFCMFKTEDSYFEKDLIDALRYNIPVLFMENSIISIVGENKYDGMFKSFDELERKIKKIIFGDSDFKNKLLMQQEEMLGKIDITFLKKTWKSSMEKMFNDSYFLLEKNKKKIAFFIEEPTNMVDLYKWLNFIKDINENFNKKYNIVVGFNEQIFENGKVKLREVLGENLDIRGFFWENMSREKLSIMQKIRGYNLECFNEEYMIPNDNINYFLDCDCWFIMSKETKFKILQIRPYAIFIDNLYDEVKKENISDEEDIKDLYCSLRLASKLIVENKKIKNEIINLIGIEKEKIEIFNYFYKKKQPIIRKKNNNNYFVVIGEYLREEEIDILFEELKKYYILGGNFKVKIIFVETKYIKIDCNISLKIKEKIDYILKFISNDIIFKQNIEVKNCEYELEYFEIIKDAWVNINLSDSRYINQGIIDATCLNTISIVKEHKYNQELYEEFKFKNILLYYKELHSELFKLEGKLSNETLIEYDNNIVWSKMEEMIEELTL